MDLSVIIVSYNVRSLLRDCLASVLAEEAQQEVIVVDNASTDGSVAMVQEQLPQVHVVANSANLGFTRANNQGLRQARGRYLLLLNPDTRVVPGAFPAMLGYMDAHPEVGGLGPQLLWPNGQVQSSKRRFPTLLTPVLEGTILRRYSPRNRVLDRYYCNDLPDDQISAVDWVSGACLLMRRAAIEQVGLLDEGYFMYSEELDWCYRARQAGWQIVYFPEAKVVHYEAQSSSQDLVARENYFQESRLRFFARHHGRWESCLLRTIILGDYLVRWTALSLLLAKRPGPEVRRDRALLGAGIRWQLSRMLGRQLT